MKTTIYLTKMEIQSLSLDHYPMLILSDNLKSWVSKRIKQHTHGQYNHAMWAIRPGWVASQGLLYCEKSIDEFLTDHHRLKLIGSLGWTPFQRNRIRNAVNVRLCGSVYRRSYDVLGILGQAVRLRWINVPWRNYCSESAIQILSQILDTHELGKHPSPADIDRWVNVHPCKINILGIYDPTVSPLSGT